MGREPFRDLMNHVVAFNSLFQEIEEKAKKLEQEKERLSYIEDIFYNSGVAIIITDREGKIKFFSRGAEALTEYKRNEIKNIAMLFAGELDFGRFAEGWEGKTAYIHGRHDKKLVQIFPSKIDGGALIILVPVKENVDIKEVNDLIKNTPFGIYILQGDVIKYANNKMLGVLGYEEKDVVGRPLINFIHPEDTRIFKKGKTAMGLRHHFEIRFVSKNGVRYAEVTSTPVTYMGEEAVLGTFIDTTERKVAEEALYMSERKYRQVVENAVEGIYRITVDGEFLEANNSFLNMFGYGSLEEISEEIENAWNLYPRENEVKKFLQIIRKSGKVRNYEMEGRRKDGKVIVTTQSAVFVREEGDGVIEGIIQDITARKKAEEEAEFYNSLLRHDLGNKNQIILGYLELLSNYDLPEKERLFLGKALDAVRAGTDLIEKIRYLHQASEETGVKVINLEKIVKKVVDGYVMEAEKNGIAIKCECNGKIKVKAGMLVEEVIANLLENSIKHSRATEIKIYPVERDGEAGICIEDNGVGIPDDMKEEIFKKKVKGKESKGSGLGLYLVKKIVEKYEGEVEVKDGDEGGTKFLIYFKKR